MKTGALGLAAVTLGIAALLVAVWNREAPAGPKAALDPLVMAVLPFQPSGEDAPASMQMGLPEILIVRLSLIPGLTVRPLSQVMALGPGPLDTLEAGRALGAFSVMTGDYRKDNGRLQARVNVIDVETGVVAWSHEVRSDAAEPPAFEEWAAREVVELLMDQPQATLNGRASTSAAQETSTARYLRLVGSGSVASLDSSLARDSIALLEAALRTSPASASVNATLSEACAGMFLGGISTDVSWLNRARALAERSVWLDPGASGGHLALGRILRIQGHKVESARSAVEVLKRDPGNGLALRLLGFLVAGCDDVRLMREARDRMVRLAPGTDPGWLDFALAVREGTTASLMERVKAALDRKQREGGNVDLLLTHLGFLAVEMRDSAGVLQAAARLDASGGASALSDSLRLHVLALKGDVSGMQRIVDANRESYTSQDEQALWVGLAWAVAGRGAEALQWVERASRLGSADAWTLDHDPRFAPLRSDPRFERAAAAVRARAAQIDPIARQALHL